MYQEQEVTIDGNEAAAYVAHALSEVLAIYPITPSTTMGELADEWSSKGQENIWGAVPKVSEMQSEGGAAGALHGAMSAGALTATFTSSQGLLLMVPNMYRMAGELWPTVFHVSSRSLACGALSMYCDHADVMATRQTGFAMLASANVQEALDFALIAHAASIKSSVPFMHFFDGFRTSHETQKIRRFGYDAIKAMIDEEDIARFKARALDPEKPSVHGTAQNADIYFAGREAVNSHYSRLAEIVQGLMDRFARLTGRHYHVFDYIGAPDAERVLVAMASGVEPIAEVAHDLNGKGAKLGLIKTRLYRPFFSEAFAKILPSSVKAIGVLDRTKEPGGNAEPLCADVTSAVAKARQQGLLKSDPIVVGGRYGLGGAEFTPAMAKACFDNLAAAQPKDSFSIGINDDVSQLSLETDESYSIADPDTFEAIFYGLSSDGTVSANKNSIKIIGEATPYYCQGYYNFESKKAGGLTASHLRFGKRPLNKPYYITEADFIACHKFSFMESVPMLHNLKEGGVFLLASHYSPKQVWAALPIEAQQQIIGKKARFYVIDALKIAKESGLGERINVIMQTAFFSISGVIPQNKAIDLIDKAIAKTYANKGDDAIKRNLRAVRLSSGAAIEVRYPLQTQGSQKMRDFSLKGASKFVREVTSALLARTAEKLPVSKLPADGRWPTATSQYEKRNVAERLPVWHPERCIACGRCALVCPHAAIRLKSGDKEIFAEAPASFKTKEVTAGPLKGKTLSIQCAPEDCTGCGACIHACPVKPKALSDAAQAPLREQEKINWNYFLSLPETPDEAASGASILETQLKRPLFEFSGACAGCGETPYIKLLSQLFGDRLLIANASGCSSVYGGYMPTVPYATNQFGRGPAWSNSLFEDNAEFGLGMQLAAGQQMAFAKTLLQRWGKEPRLVEKLVKNEQKNSQEIEAQREAVQRLKKELAQDKSEAGARLLSVADSLVKKSVWAFGGDGWAYDIGYGGLDHALASGENLKMLVLDTEVYSNTGGQASKATPLGAQAKFAAAGKGLFKKPLALMQSLYGHIYVAQINLGANMAQTLSVLKEAEAFNGPALVVAYSHCISHGIDMGKGFSSAKAATQCGMWPLFRFNPDLKRQGKNPFILESGEPDNTLEEYLYSQNRFKNLLSKAPERAAELLAGLKQGIADYYSLLKRMAQHILPPEQFKMAGER